MQRHFCCKYYSDFRRRKVRYFLHVCVCNLRDVLKMCLQYVQKVDCSACVRRLRKTDTLFKVQRYSLAAVFQSVRRAFLRLEE